MRRTVLALVAAALAGCADPPDRPLPDAVRQTAGSALVLHDVPADSAVVSVRGDARRPVVGLTALVTALAAETLSPAARAVQLPASHLRRRRLPGLEPERADTAVWTLDALLDAALRGDRAAGDEALDRVGREAAEAAAPDGVDAPLPLGGLVLAWAPTRRGGRTPPAARAEAFLALAPEAQRDSAFARDRAFLNSQAYRADETMRLQREGLGLSADTRHALALASLPAATAEALARLAARPVVRDRLLALPGTASAPARTAVARAERLGAALSVSPDGRRIGVLLWQDEPHADAAEALASWVQVTDPPP